MMRFRITSLLCFLMLTSAAYAAQPTKTIAQGGWFAIGGPSETADMLCGGSPCTDQAFANAFGSILSNIPVMNTDLYDSRGQATSALVNGDFSIGGEVCLPSDSGLSGAMVSGFVSYYTLNNFTYEQLDQAAGVPSSEGRIFEITQAIFMWLSNLGLSSLAVNSSGPLLNSTNGLPVDPFTFQTAFTDLNLQGYETITRWASAHSAVVNGVRVTNLQTSNVNCP